MALNHNIETFSQRTKPDEFYIEVFARIYYAMLLDIETSTLDSNGDIINNTTTFINEGNDYFGGYLDDLHSLLQRKLATSPSITIEEFKAYNNRLYLGWIYNQDSIVAKDYLFLQGLFYPDDPKDDSINPTPINPDPFDPPVYIIRDTNRQDGQGPRGRIIFSSYEELDQKILRGRGEMDFYSYDIGGTFVAAGLLDSKFEFKDVTLTSEDFNTLALGEQIVNNLQLQLTNFFKGRFKDEANLIIVSGTNPTTTPGDIYEYEFKGRVESNSNNQALSQVLISDDLDTQGLLGSSCLSEKNGTFVLKGEYIAQSPKPSEIYNSIEYVVKEGDTLSIIAKKYPQTGASGNDIPFYPDRAMHIYKANPIMEGRSISLNEAANESQVLQNENLISPGDTITVPFYNYEVSIKTFNITFEKENYISKVIIPFTSNNDILLYNKILLQSKETSKKEIIKTIPLTDAQISSTTSSSTQQDPMGAFTSKVLQDLLKQLKMTLIPFLIGLLAKFGINNIEDALKKGASNINLQCPADLQELNEIISAKNKLTKSLNNMYKKLDSIKTGVEFSDKIITVANVVFSSLSALVLAFPAIPFAPDVTKLFSTTLPGINKSTQEVIANTLTLLKALSSATLVVLNLFLQNLQKALNYNALLDQAISDCALNFTDGPNSNNGDNQNGGGIGILTQVKLTEELQGATILQSLNGNPVIPETNGFTFNVIPVDGVEVSGLKRRQAVAKNDQKVIMLKGEPSFSSNDQILIDELIYYIKQNNLTPDGTGVGIT